MAHGAVCPYFFPPEPPPPPPEPPPPQPPPPPAPTPTAPEVTAPASAGVGATVNVSVKVTNSLEYGYRFRTLIHRAPDLYPSQVILTATDNLLSGASKTYTAAFVMPDCNVTVLVWVETELGAVWQYYSSASKVVTVGVVGAAEFRNLAAIYHRA